MWVALNQGSTIHRPSSDFCPARHLKLDWHYIAIQLTYSAKNLCNRNISSNPLLTSTRNVYCQEGNIKKTSWQMRNIIWKYSCLWTTFFFFKMKYTKRHLRTKLLDDHLDDVLLQSSNKYFTWCGKVIAQ